MPRFQPPDSGRQPSRCSHRRGSSYPGRMHFGEQDLAGWAEHDVLHAQAGRLRRPSCPAVDNWGNAQWTRGVLTRCVKAPNQPARVSPRRSFSGVRQSLPTTPYSFSVPRASCTSQSAHLPQPDWSDFVSRPARGLRLLPGVAHRTGGRPPRSPPSMKRIGLDVPELAHDHHKVGPLAAACLTPTRDFGLHAL